jgi:hypothetical protein
MGGMLSAILLFLSRSFVLPFIASAFGSGRDGNMNYILEAEKHPLLFLGCSLPALLVGVAWFRRVPAAGRLTRFIWSWGRWLMMLSALLDIVARLASALHPDRGITPFLLMFDGVVVLYLFIAPRARDVFADFPLPDDSNK